jgi:hypothetical protein
MPCAIDWQMILNFQSNALGYTYVSVTVDTNMHITYKEMTGSFRPTQRRLWGVRGFGKLA